VETFFWRRREKKSRPSAPQATARKVEILKSQLYAIVSSKFSSGQIFENFGLALLLHTQSHVR